MPGADAFDVDVREAAELGAADYDGLVSTPPLMNDRRIVVLKNVPAVSAQVRDLIKATLAEASGTLCLIGTGAATMRGNLYDVWEKNGTRIACELPRKFDFARWLAGRARADFGKKLDHDAAHALSELGAELGTLYRELEKAALYAGDADRITLDHVAAVCTGGRVGTVWEWCDAVGGGDAGRALALLKDLLDAGESAYRLVPLLATHFCRLGVVVSLGTTDPGRIQAALPGRTWPAMARSLAGQARHHTPESVARALDLLAAADLMLKSTGHSEEFVMQTKLMEIFQNAA